MILDTNALSAAADGGLSRTATPRSGEDSGLHRSFYFLPAEDSVRDIVAELAAPGGLEFREWSSALPHNPVWSARRNALTSRGTNQLHDGQARAAAAAALLRQLFVVITKRVAWDPAIAAGTTVPEGVSASAA